MMDDYPAWVCADCGERWGRRECREATWHPDTCGVCGERKSVTEPRDFGHLRDGWQSEATKWDTDSSDLAVAVAEFEAALPGWWWSVGMCAVGAHASCAVDARGVAAHLLHGINEGCRLDAGFHCDTDGGQPSEALRDVMQQALAYLKATP